MDKDEQNLAFDWASNGERGISSNTIFAVMTKSVIKSSHYSVPLDPSDFWRCKKLLEKIPTWRGRLQEVADTFPDWQRLVDRWDEIDRMYENECMTGRCPKTYDMIKECISSPQKRSGTMAENTKIEWTDHTFNPWWGCTKVSDGCKNCYAANMGKRFGVDWGPGANRIPASESMWKQPHKWNRAAARDGVRRRVFCASMADVFDDHPSILPEWRFDLWGTIRDTPHLDWLLLTKRPENFRHFLPKSYQYCYPCKWENVWLGVSAEDTKTFAARWEASRGITAKRWFISCEPLLGDIFLDTDMRPDWVICGGETGPGARPMNLGWARSLRNQCVAAGVPFFFKSTGGKNKTDLLDGRTWREFPA